MGTETPMERMKGMRRRETDGMMGMEMKGMNGDGKESRY